MALLLLQTFHSIIFLISIMAMIWLWVGLLTRRRGRWVWAASVWMSVIALGLVLNGGVCHLQKVARWIEGTDSYVKDMLTLIWFNNAAVPFLTPPTIIAMIGLGIVELRKRR